jgi:hypothetical protein
LEPSPGYYLWEESYEQVMGKNSSKRHLHDLDFSKQIKRKEFIVVDQKEAHLPYKNSVGLSLDISSKCLRDLSPNRSNPP